MSVRFGARVTVPCKAIGYPEPMVTWSSLESKSVRTLDGNLIIESADFSTRGKYRCEASNGVGEPAHAVIEIHVNGKSHSHDPNRLTFCFCLFSSSPVPAQFVDGEEKFSVQNVKKGSSASIRCRCIGDEPLSIQWHRDKQLIDSKQVSRYDHHETRTGQGLSSEMTIRSTERADNAVYSCVVRNEYGQQERSVKLLVLEVPESPRDVRIVDVWSKSVSISWSHPFNGNSQVTKYVLSYWRDGRNHHRNQKLHQEDLKPSVTSHIVKDLLPGTNYAITVTAVNDVGSGEPSAPSRFTTGEEEPTAAPTDVVLQARSSKSMFVSWLAPPRHQWNGNITGYYIYYRTGDVTQPYVKTAPAEHHHNASRKYGFLVTGLSKSSHYMVSVKAYNKAGTGPSSQELSITTLAGDPPQPPRIEGFNVMSKSLVKVNWRYVHKDFADLTLFTVYCQRIDSGHYISITPVSKHSSSYVVQNLEAGLKYSFFVSASNSFGEGELSDPVLVHLYESPLGFMLLLAESNIILASAIAISIVTIVLAICASVLYVRRAEVKHDEEVRRYKTLARTIPRRYSDKCGTFHSSETYATIPADRPGQVTMRSNESRSQTSSYDYGGPCLEPQMAMTSKRMSVTMKKSKDYDEIVYDDTTG